MLEGDQTLFVYIFMLTFIFSCHVYCRLIERPGGITRPLSFGEVSTPPNETALVFKVRNCLVL